MREWRGERLIGRSWMEREIKWSEESRKENGGGWGGWGGGAGRDGGQTDRR